MTEPFVNLTGVGLRFRMGSNFGLKERVLQTFRPPSWRSAVAAASERWALRDIDLRLASGDRLAVVGANGAGKSTLLRLLSRIYRPTVGTAVAHGTVAPLIEIGAGFNPDLTGRENVFLNAAILGVKARDIRRRLGAIVEFSELGDYIDVPVKCYSTGMLLRLAFAVATEISPDILILDELFAGADAAFLARAHERLRELSDRCPILVVVSHNVDDLKRYCNRAILLRDGKIAARGGLAETIGIYATSSEPSENSRPQAAKPWFAAEAADRHS